MFVKLVSLIALALDISIGTRFDSIGEIYLIVSHKCEPCTISLALLTLILATCKSEVLRYIIKNLGELPDLDGFLNLSSRSINEDTPLAGVCMNV